MGSNQPKRFREYISTIFIFAILAGLLVFYFLKYVPERRGEFNQTAFLELNQIESALQSKNKAYHDAIQIIVPQEQIDTNSLLKFNFKATVKNPHPNKNDSIGTSRFELDDSEGSWQLLFPVYSDSSKKEKINTKKEKIDTTKGKIDTKKEKIYTLSKNADSLMSGFVSTYKDIFDGYLLIDNQDTDEEGGDSKGEIIFQSGDLHINFLTNPDSLLKKNGGFSQTSLQDVTIEGNQYKLFLFPFYMSSQKLVLAGLISDSHYREANQKIPFYFFTIFTVLFLLLVIHLPILRIYILGPNERVRETDIRLIIGSYFIAAFFGFFLFTKIFLDKEQAVQNKNHLDTLSNKIKNNFRAELDSISRQLNYFDQKLATLRGKYDTNYLNKKNNLSKDDIDYLNALCGIPKDSSSIKYLDTLFKPRIYPYPNNVFWTNKSGKWVARWSFKKKQTRSPMIDVKDRSYYLDFKNREPLSIPGIAEPLTVQPTLSKLEGEYIITIAKKSEVLPYKLNLPLKKPKKNEKDTIVEIDPFLIGLSSKMHSVFNVIMPSGYGFSIIDESGNIQYDSKAGRPLLSNIFKEMEDPERIQQSAIYRNTRYFESIRLRSKNMALLSTPIDGMPYQLLVYYNRFRSDGFEEHLIILSAGLIGVVILLLIFSALTDKWSKAKYRMLESRSHHFEWLHPSADPLKQKYLLHLIRWMFLLLGVYLLAWLFMETLAPGSEFSLLFISLLFPFYLAILYYELRERYYDVLERRTDINWYYSRPSIILRGLLLIIIILINCFTSFVKFSSDLASPVLVTQLIWAAMIALSTFRFRFFMMKEKNPDIPESIRIPVKNEFIRRIRAAMFALATHRFRRFMMRKKNPDARKSKAIPVNNGKPNLKYKIPRAYIWAILTGVILISIIPASGIFWLFFRHETGLYLNADQLTLSKEIDQRSQTINQDIKLYKYHTSDATDVSNIGKLKFSHGIYMISGQPFANESGTDSARLHYPSTEFIQLHDQFFPSDSLVLDWIDSTYKAADGTWNFAVQSEDKLHGPELLFRKRKDAINPNVFRVTADSSASWNTAGLIGHSFSGMGTAFSIFFIVGLCFSLTIAYFLTLSLAKRIFLMELQLVVDHFKNQDNFAEKLYERSGIQPAIRSMILETSQQFDISLPLSSKNKIPFIKFWRPGLKDIYFFEKKLPISLLEAEMPLLIDTLKPVYSVLWEDLTERQKFILFDFAQDGFANYKAGRDLQALIEKGLLFFDDLRLSVITLSFQEYVLQQNEDSVINTYLAKTAKDDTWKKFKTPMLILLTAAGIFVFVTQEEVYQKITGLLATLTSLLPLLGNMFKPGGKGDG